MTDVPEDGLVSTGWLAERLDDPALRIVDATWHLPNVDRSGRADYEAAHIPGALYWDIDGIAAADDPRPHMLPEPDAFAAMMGALGIGDEHVVVAYDGSGLSTAARVWWTLRRFGHAGVAVLDGGLPKWRGEGRPIEAGTHDAPPAVFTARPPLAGLRDAATILAGLARRDEQILDARSAGRFAGTEPEPRPGCRPGHIPGSLSLPYTDLLDPDSKTVLPPDALRRRFADAGVDLAAPVVTTCGSGVTACVLALGLHRVGHRDVAVYDGSWSEWGVRDDLPIEP